MNPPPELIALDHDDYHAKYVGVTSHERQFFATTPFVPAGETAGREFDALYIFDLDGNLLEARVDELGTRAELEANIEAARELRARKIAALGRATYGRIEMKPFQIERFGVTFGLLLHSPEKFLEGDEDPEEVAELMEMGWSATLEPGNFMAFHEPWNSGEYDT